MTLSIDDIKRTARLAQIETSEQEAQQTLEQLSAIFELIAQMQQVDTTDVAPMSHAQDMVQRLRDDQVTETDQHLLFQSIAPQVEADLYLVPRVIE
ncbi:MAG: Asp-tRNA(Asn)/Glu-tRNA(Gln) amidotransferase subunit GatC [Nitrosomonas sp.]|nr:Asp-tRNA(Asn)/Glu-tRNA(Gln) amidotransferase subunit GatC [Nitrosomonas sp.]